MNIFLTDPNPLRAAADQHDQHLRKMILETAQIIDGGTRCIMHQLYGAGDYEIVRIPKSHRDNPVILSALDPVVLKWCANHLVGLLGEYRFRWGCDHAYADLAISGALRRRVGETIDYCNRDVGFRLAMPDDVRDFAPQYTRNLSVVVTTYRRYYRTRKMRYGKAHDKIPTWTKRLPPAWCLAQGFDQHTLPDGKYILEATA